MNPEQIAPIYIPDVDGATGGYLGLRFTQEGEELVSFQDEAHQRTLKYSGSTGKLVGIGFLDPLGIDIMALPHDDVVSDEHGLASHLISEGVQPAQLITVFES